MLGPGRYKHRLELVMGQGGSRALAWMLGQVLIEVLRTRTWMVPGTRTSPKRTGVWTQARLSPG